MGRGGRCDLGVAVAARVCVRQRHRLDHANRADAGAALLVPIFRTTDKQFSTAFNFGDHIAVGMQFGEGGLHEVSLRLQHFSSACIKEPNPGENFVQLRYGMRY
jgi:hypothetical protein